MKPESKLGHILTIRYMGQAANYVIIGQRQNRKGRVVYVYSEWHEERKRFMELDEDSYFFQSGKATISTKAFPMSESHKAMARAIRLGRVIRLVNRSINRVGVGLVHYDSVKAETGYRGRFDVGDKTGYMFSEDEPEFLFGNPEIKAERIALKAKLLSMWREEMELAGIVIVGKESGE